MDHPLYKHYKSFTNSGSLFEQSYVMTLSYGLKESCLATNILKIHAAQKIHSNASLEWVPICHF